jgi:hypothetical protein
MAPMTYDEKVYDLASAFLEDEPNLFTMHHNHHLACAIQRAIEDYIADANRNYEPKDSPGFEGGFADNH